MEEQIKNILDKLVKDNPQINLDSEASRKRIAEILAQNLSNKNR